MNHRSAIVERAAGTLRRAAAALGAQNVSSTPIAAARRFGDLKLFELITMLRLSRYATAKSAVVYGLQGGRVSVSACSAGPPWGDGVQRRHVG